MFDVAPTELLLVAVVALVVIGPKDLPNAMRFVGRWVAKAQGVARHFRSGIDEMVRQAELEEMERKWAAENERIMREHPVEPDPSVREPVMESLPAPAPHVQEAPAGAVPIDAGRAAADPAEPRA
ncbi:Sec-independent protein translocase protein TatB [Sphingomonas jatrophae]|uniref:Sec-independent protein translocase protein TatB n=1 Tax=Sphingomonas jatrophae TaxID=1166337 RepID=A0A1I6JG73_9SPHN|nr:sec-independent protein translocase protein TatB [Sphingomonas jatrophae]